MDISKIFLVSVLAMALAFAGVTVMEESDAVNVTTFDDLQSALGAEGDATITVTNEIQVGELITVAGNKTITSSNNGTILRATSYAEGSLISIPSNSSLTLSGNLEIDGNSDWITDNQSNALIRNQGTLTIQDDVTLRNNHFGVHASWGGVAAVGGSAITNTGTLNLLGGSITENSGGNGAVYSDGGTVTMQSFDITDNETRAVALDGVCTFNMRSGTISGNTSGVSVESDVFRHSTFNMSGGTISENSGAINGGGVYLGYGGIFNMTGGEISDNRLSSSSLNTRGGGVYISNDGSATLSGGTISGNSALEGGGVYVAGALTISGTEISSNSYEGIYSISPDVLMTGGSLDSNGVRLYGGTFCITGGTVTNSPNAVSHAGISMGTFEIGGDAKFDSRSYVSIMITLVSSDTSTMQDHAITLRPSTYVEGQQWVRGSPAGLVSINHSKIDVTPYNGEAWEIDEEGCLVNTHVPASTPSGGGDEGDGDSSSGDSTMTLAIAAVIVIVIILAIVAVLQMRKRSGDR